MKALHFLWPWIVLVGALLLAVPILHVVHDLNGWAHRFEWGRNHLTWSTKETTPTPWQPLDETKP